jgi:hypothetical protein
MDLDEIRAFVTIARERSFSAAAGTLGRSQPAISRRRPERCDLVTTATMSSFSMTTMSWR